MGSRVMRVQSNAMLDDPNLGAAEAKYFLLTCASFVNYLKAKM